MKNTILIPTFMRKDDRGIFVEALNGYTWKTVIFGQMKKNAVMGNHYHKKTAVYFFITRGLATVYRIDTKTEISENITLHKNEGIIFPPYCFHAIHFQKNSMFVMGKSEVYDKRRPDTYENPTGNTLAE